MILKCPVSTCKHITTRPLPTGFCGSATKPVVRRGMGSNVKVRSKSGVEGKKKQTKKDILLEQFTDVPIPSSLPFKAPSVLHTDIEWLIYGVKVFYTVLILAVCAGFALGFETVFSNPVAHLENSFSPTTLPILVTILLAVEFVPEEALLAHRESIRWAIICDLLLILVLSAASCGTIHFGSAHALSQYLSMSLSSHFLILLVASVVVLKCTSVMYGCIVQLSSIATGIFTSIRHSSYITNALGRPNTTTPAITPIAEHVFITPKKHNTHSTSTPSSTVRTMGLEYDSRYVCAPLLSIDYPEYSELTDYSELSEQSPLVHRKQIRNTLASSVDAVDTTATTLSTTDDCTDVLEANNINITATNSNTIHLIYSAAADLSPTAQSETTLDIVAKVSMDMLADGYPWDEGVNCINTNNNTTIKVNTSESAVLGGNDAAVVPSNSTCVIYSDVQGLGLVNKVNEDEIINHIAFQPTVTNTAMASESIDTTPIENDATRGAQVVDNDLPDADEDGDNAEHTITSDNDIDVAYALNCIYINPQEVELAMEKECTNVKEEECALMSPSTYNPIHSSCTNHEQVLDVPSSSHSSVSSIADVHSLQYSDSSRSTPVTPTNQADCLSITADPTHNDSDVTLVSPYAMSSALESVNTVDVYQNPAPLFKVPKNPSPNQDLFVSPVETPVKGIEIGSGATPNKTATAIAPDGDNTNADKLITSITSMYAHVPVYITPTKSIRSQWQHNTNTPKTMNMYQTYNSSVLHSPFYANTSSVTTTPTVESPDDEFRLRSNIKLKPLGRLSFGGASDIDTATNSASAKTSAYDNFVEHPISPEPHLAVSPRANTIKNNNNNNSMHVQNAASTSTTTTTTKNSKNTTNKDKKGNPQGLPRWKSILGPGNLIR